MPNGETETAANMDTSDNIEALAETANNRRRSVVWQHFTKMKVNDLDKAQCKYCKKFLGGKSANGTKHLLQHMERCLHKKEAFNGTKHLLQHMERCLHKNDYDAFVRKKKRAKTSLVRTELDHYLDEEVLPRSPGFDVLLWWKLNGIKYPTLQAIAKDILAIPISTVASESAFSTSGQILSPHRSRLHWTTLEALMCARSWLWSAENSGNMSSKISNEYATLLDEIEPEDEGEILTSGVASLFEDGD